MLPVSTQVQYLKNINVEPSPQEITKSKSLDLQILEDFGEPEAFHVINLGSRWVIAKPTAAGRSLLKLSTAFAPRSRYFASPVILHA
ncbi:hypothetical protein LshimejAT787_1004110 [Lyophyllum shimeji]|uniref:Uncharacterized protein n=1 Tax=Lyophyllum shimeji TaxID=47721 RepID=A0A9P3PUA0_LYOSH|nr:hypothetical protein LshimejAT787_1004110 [Lyophyllum shimeji]